MTRHMTFSARSVTSMSPRVLSVFTAVIHEWATRPLCDIRIDFITELIE